MLVKDCDIYAEQLIDLGHGYPLWEPGPSNGHRRVELGDVGYIQNGHFQFLFNAKTAGSVHNKFVSLPSRIDTYEGNPRGPMTISSRSIKILEGGAAVGADQVIADLKLEFEVKRNRDRGAAISTRFKTQVVDISQQKLFQNYIKAHFSTWHSAFEQEHDIQPGDLILVTGFDITDGVLSLAIEKKWALVSRHKRRV